MRLIWVIFFKEIRDNLRDRRSLFFALIYGPLLMPALLLGPMILMSGKKAEQYESIQTIHVDGLNRAPNLMAYLRSQNIDVLEAETDYESKILNAEYKLVLKVPERYGANLLAAQPAPLQLHYVNDSDDSRDLFHRVSSVLSAYGQSIAGQRLWARGMEQKVLQPLYVEAIDLSNSEPLLDIIGKLFQFIVVLSMVMGAFYLAVDIVAGERERSSLEPLLSLPVSRRNLLFGKFLSILFFSVLCSLLATVNSFIWLLFMSDSMYGSADVPTLVTICSFILLMLPLATLFSSVLLLLSIFSKTVKEAQTQFSAVMLVAMAPFLALQFVDIDSSSFMASLPVLGHYLLIENLLFNASFSLTQAWPVSIGSILLTGMCLGIATRLFKADDLLGA